MSADHQSAWFLLDRESQPGGPHVFCFAHAGGNPRTFLQWQCEMDASAGIVGVTMPGRAHRFNEPMPKSIEEYADGAAAAIDAVAGGQPYYLFGHSLGALVAFEVARRLADTPGLRHLVASGSSAPSLLPSARVREAAALEGRAFAEAVGFFGGLPPEIVAAEELHDLLLPSVQADFRLVAGYTYASAPPLPVGITLINGRDDPHVAPTALDAWATETRTPVQRHWSSGGHFYFEDHPRAVPDVLREVIAGQAATASPDHSELTI